MKLRVGFRRLGQVLEVRQAERTGDLPSVRDQLAALLPVLQRVLGSNVVRWSGQAG